MVVYGMRNGCGLGTEFDLPAHTLAASASVSDMHSSCNAKAALTYVTIKKGVLDIVSQTVFDDVRVVNPLGRTVFSRAMGSHVVRAMVPLSGKTGACSPGILFLVLAKERRIIYCQPLPQ
jgi:hypothetical protein